MAIRAASSGRRTAPRRVARQVGVATPRSAADMLQLHPELGNQAVLRLLDAYSASQRGVAARGHSVVQRFESQEHERIGNEATGAAGKSVLTLQLAGGPVDISYGEIVALSADWFSPDDRAPDGLFHLANIKGKGGSGVGTADEIVFAILEYNFEEEQRRHPDPKLEEPPDSSRFPGFKATKDVQKSVKDRYRNLGAKNGAHFVAPRGRDAQGNINPTHQGESSAGSNYRELHEVAITRAYALGRNNVDTTEAMAREAAAQHFLTDEFSAGHLRTPTADIRDHWASKYPLFWFNLRQKIALDTASSLWDEQIHFPFSAFTSPKAIYDKIIAQIMEVTSSYPEVSFGDLAAKIFHDYDNMVGLDIGDGARVFGDAKLGRTGRQDDVTLMAAKEAVRAGLDDIKAAASLGLGDAIAGTPTRTGETLFAAVRTETGMSGSQYKPESLVPVPSSSNPEQNWKADNVETLWDMPMVVGGKYTAGEMIAFELQPGQEIDGQLQELGKQFPGPKQEGPITVDARMAYQHGFLQPMERDPLSGLLDILHWSPKSPALSSGARGDLAVETGKQLEKQKLLPGMTTPARIEYVKDLCGGRTGEDGEALVVRIFESAAAGERPQIYLGVEGHAWTGAFRRGFFKKDLLFKKLSNERLDRLTVLINEGVGKPHEVLPTPKTRVAPPGSRKGPDQVEPVPDQGPPKPRHVTVPARALFDFGKRTLRAEAVAVLLDQLGDHPRHADPNSPFTVTGHTDSIGNPNFNLTLSKDRAVSVKGVLEPTYPNLQDKVATDGRGAAEPVEPNTVNGKDNPEGRAKNRRVEIEFVELVPRFKP